MANDKQVFINNNLCFYNYKIEKSLNHFDNEESTINSDQINLIINDSSALKFKNIENNFSTS
jgi:hypothetical protein